MLNNKKIKHTYLDNLYNYEHYILCTFFCKIIDF